MASAASLPPSKASECTTKDDISDVNKVTLLSSKCVEGVIYNLVASCPASKKRAADNPASSTGSLTSKQRSPVRVQRARKSFPASVGGSGFKIPQTDGAEQNSVAQLLDAREKQTVLDRMKLSYTSQEARSSFSESNQSSRRAPREVPGLIQIAGQENLNSSSPLKKERLDSGGALSDDSSTTREELIGSPPTPASTPAPPLNKDDPVFAEMAALLGENLEEEDAVSSTVPIARSPSVHEINSDSSDCEAAPKSGIRLKVSGKFESSKANPAKSPSSPMATKRDVAQSSTNSSTKRSRFSRELERLYMDEGAERILNEMARRGSNRRSTATTTTNNNNNNMTQVAPAKSRPQRTTQESKKKALTNGAKATLKDEGKADIQKWGALQTRKPDRSEIIFGNKLRNPADGSTIIHRHSYSSDSTTTDEAGAIRQMEQKAESSSTCTSLKVPSPTRVVLSSPESFSNPLNDHGYTRNLREEPILGIGAFSSDGEIVINSLDRHLVHVTLSPSSVNPSSPPNSLNTNVLKELTLLLRHLKDEKEVRVVLITSAGPEFCTGIDISTLLSDSHSVRKENARNLSNIIQDFILELANCDKILVGGLKGSAVGLGVTMLRYFDLVYASDKSTFYLPYAKLAQGPEGGSSLALQNSSTASNLFGLMLYEGRRLTATEAQSAGLVNDVLWPASFREDLMPRVQSLAAQSSQAMLYTKKNLRVAFRLKLPAILKQESKLLRETWASDEFQRRAAAVLSSGQLLA